MSPKYLSVVKALDLLSQTAFPRTINGTEYTNVKLDKVRPNEYEFAYKWRGSNVTLCIIHVDVNGNMRVNVSSKGPIGTVIPNRWLMSTNLTPRHTASTMKMALTTLLSFSGNGFQKFWRCQ